VGSRTSAERSSPSAGVLVSSSSHDKSLDFLHHGLSNQQHDLDGNITTQGGSYNYSVAMAKAGGGPCTSLTDDCGWFSTTVVCSCASSGTTSSVAEGELVLLSQSSPPQYPRFLSYPGSRVRGRDVLRQYKSCSQATDYSSSVLDYSSRGTHLLSNGF
jgi:hypothetical protein